MAAHLNQTDASLVEPAQEINLLGVDQATGFAGGQVALGSGFVVKDVQPLARLLEAEREGGAPHGLAAALLSDQLPPLPLAPEEVAYEGDHGDSGQPDQHFQHSDTPVDVEAAREALEDALSGTDYSAAPEGLRLLPRSRWTFEADADGHLIVGALAEGQFRDYRRVVLSSKGGEPLTGLDNLVAAIVAAVDIRAVAERGPLEASQPSGVAAHGD